MNTPPAIRILVADDHPVVRDGLVSILAMQEDMKVVAQAEDGEEAVAAFEQTRPDVLVLDLRMPRLDGIEVVQRVLTAHPGSKILIVTTYQTDEDIYRCLKSGALGYILKDSNRETIIEAVREVAAGQSYTPARIASRLVRQLAQNPLTPRELDVLQHVASGLANKQVAEALGVSEGTVKTHLKSILEKLRAQSRTEAVTLARKQGILRD
ncbi:MAG: response regulator transcription factor [Opitutales bacterium]|nr:response regulator transcription factor [Opitutales bacterium]